MGVRVGAPPADRDRALRGGRAGVMRVPGLSYWLQGAQDLLSCHCSWCLRRRTTKTGSSAEHRPQELSLAGAAPYHMRLLHALSSITVAGST